MNITLNKLAECQACETHLLKMRMLFPAGGEITEERVSIAARSGLNVRFLVEHYLPSESLSDYDQHSLDLRNAFHDKLKSHIQDAKKKGSKTNRKKNSEYAEAAQIAQGELCDGRAKKIMELIEVFERDN